MGFLAGPARWPMEHRLEGPTPETIVLGPQAPATLEHDGPWITDPIERLGPAHPVDRPPAGRFVGVLAAVVVVHMGRGQEAAGGHGLLGERGGDVGVSGIERQ